MKSSPVIEWIDLAPSPARFAAEVVAGLGASPKRLPAKLFYDERGSELFEQITRLPEYYLTRAEIEILTEQGRSISRRVGRDAALIELGSGSSRKTRLLLDVLEGEVAYMPVDISASTLRSAAEGIARAYPAVSVTAICADYMRHLEIPDGSAAKRVVFFPGSNIGNLEPVEATEFFRRVAAALRKGDGLLLGADLRKDPEVLHAAYNDSAGVTAEFNLNVLVRIQRELQSNVDPEAFDHLAFYDQEEGRIEMHLVSRTAQEVEIEGESFFLDAGERIHTESSYKYEIPQLHAILRPAGFVPLEVWQDRERRFSLHYLELR